MSLLRASFSIVLATILIHVATAARSCTIISGVDQKGDVWTGNNEDGYSLDTPTYINLFPKTDDGKYGYITLSCDSPKNGENGQIQGGMNEAGLTFDFNALSHDFEVVGLADKTPFPKGDAAILPHILGNLATVEEVVKFFETHWFEGGFRSAQMHVADKNGHFAIISPSGSKIVADRSFLVSTNFSICGNEDGSSCWRYPIATKMLKEKGASLESFIDICRSTAQEKEAKTMYSNIQNLSTGGIWFFSAQDYDNPYVTDIRKLLGQGRTSFRISELHNELK